MRTLMLAPTLALMLLGGGTPLASAAGTPNSQADCNARFVTTFAGPGFGQVVAGLAQSEQPLGRTDVSLTATGAVPCPV